MKERLDILLVDRRLVESRTKAQWLIKNGFVLVNNVEIVKPGKKIDNSSELKLIKEFPYVGKGGIKLEAALKDFSISVKDKVCVDIGASIGGFTDCLLKHGAKKVYAIDTAKDLLHPSLTCEKMKDKVFPLLGIDARQLKTFNDRINIVTSDVTFSSLKGLLPNVKNYLEKNGDIIALVKPLFETDFYNEKLKVIDDPEKLKAILIDLFEWGLENEIYPQRLMKSPLLGEGGAIEFFIHFKLEKKNLDHDYIKKIEQIVN